MNIFLYEEILKAEQAIKNTKDLIKMSYKPIETIEEFKKIMREVIPSASKRTRVTKSQQEPSLKEMFQLEKLGLPVDAWKDIIEYQKKLKAESVKRKVLK